MECCPRSEPQRPFQAIVGDGPTGGKARMWQSIRALDYQGFVDGDAGWVDMVGERIEPAQWIVECFSQLHDSTPAPRATGSCSEGASRPPARWSWWWGRS